MSDYRNYQDRELVALIHASDETAFAELYNRHWKSLYYTASSILKNSETARDIVQEVFTSFWQRRLEVTVEFPKAYLQQAIRFQVFKAIDAGKATRQFYDRLADTSLEIVEENPVVFKDLLHLVQGLIDRLPEDARMAFMLNRDEKLTYSEIAEKMDISVKTVEKKMSQTLKHLRKGLGTTLTSLLFIL
jgi:RNA polymerase sigma-70 factor (family 1)